MSLPSLPLQRGVLAENLDAVGQEIESGIDPVTEIGIEGRTRASAAAEVIEAATGGEEEEIAPRETADLPDPCLKKGGREKLGQRGPQSRLGHPQDRRSRGGPHKERDVAGSGLSQGQITPGGIVGPTRAW